MSKPTLDDWLWVELMLVQALIGAISHNFRQVALCRRDADWCVQVILAEEDADDREEIDDIADQLATLLEDIRDRISASAYARVAAEIQVNRDALEFVQSESQRLVFRRKEPA